MGITGRNRGFYALALSGLLLLGACDVRTDVAGASSERSQSEAPRDDVPETRPSLPKKPKTRPDKPKPEPEKPVRKVPGVAAMVTRVIDGDTIEASRNGRVFSVRLIGIDTPETVHPSEPVECFGKEASAFASRMLTGKHIKLEFDVERKDHYDRHLGYIWLGGRMFNRMIVAKGYAQAYTYPPNVRYTERFLAAQRKARSENRGLWSGCPAEKEQPTPAGKSGGKKCDPNYSGACVPPYPPDIDCSDMKKKNFRSTGGDPHGFDGDGDGRACES